MFGAALQAGAPPRRFLAACRIALQRCFPAALHRVVAGEIILRSPAMEDAMASSESELRALFDRRSEAMRAKDIDRLMLLFAPEIVYFDVVPPLRYAGSEALRNRFLHWFEGWKGPIGMQTRELNILAGEDVAAADMLIRASGTRANGREVGYWVRTSNGCRREKDRWLITHEHVSLPVDFESGRVALDLQP
jgi:ketosteroid isomerase-like protein